jgi:hypothetical protein
MQFSKTRFAGIAAATTAAVAYGVYRFRSTDDDSSSPDEDASAAA